MNRPNKLIILITINILGVCLLAWGAKMNWWLEFDLQVTHFVQTFHPQIWDLVMKSVSWIGYPPQTMWVTMGILAALMLVLGWKEGLVAQATSTGAYVTGNFFKLIVNRSRPENFDIIAWQQGLEGGKRSFPAGHVEIFTALCLVSATIVLRKYSGLRGKIVTSLIILYLVLLGISRIYLGEHWLTDVLAGYLVGLTWWALFMLIFPRYGQKNPQRPKIQSHI